MWLSQRVQRCAQSPMRKFAADAVAAQKNGREIFQLNIGQPDIQTPDSFYQAVRNAREKVLSYAPSPGDPDLVEAIVEYYRRLGIVYRPGDILITTGGSEALQILMQCILDPGSEILIPEPFYPNYQTFVQAADGVIVPIPTSPEEGYRYAFRQRIEGLVTDRTRAILVSNPGNPTGVVLSMEEMQILADIAKAHGLYLIGDEVYREFCYEGTAHSLAELDGMEDHICLIDSVSKRFSACGARVGCLISKNQALMAQALKFCQARLSVASLDQMGASALYRMDSAYFEAVRQEYMARRDTAVRCLRQIPGVLVPVPQGAFYLMTSLPIDDAERFQTWLLREFSDQNQTVMFSPGAGFYGTPGRGRNEIRIAYVLQQSRLERAIELLGIALAAYGTSHL